LSLLLRFQGFWEPDMNQPNDKLAAIENTKTVRGIMLGGKIAGAFAAISAGLLAVAAWISWSVDFANSPNVEFVMPGTICLLCLAALNVHCLKAPILAAPVIMFGFVGMSILSIFMCIGFFVGGALGSAVSQGVDVDPLLEMHAIDVKHAKTDKEIGDEIAKSKESLMSLKEHRLLLSKCHFVVGMLAFAIAIQGFFSRLWLMEDAIIDTQWRLITLSERCLEMAHTANTNLQALCLSVPEQDKHKFKEIAVASDQTEQAMESLKDELKDFPAVGFRKGPTLNFKRRKS
jgi:hypothetical protein